nr:hypothetical protein [Tanacetum cinerariifolium]
MTAKERLSLLSLAYKQDRTGKTSLRPLPCPMTQHQGLLLLMLMRAARIKLLEDKDKRSAEPIGEDAPIKGRNVSVPPVARVSTVGVPSVSGLVPTVSAIFTTASVVTPYSRRPREILAKDKSSRPSCKDTQISSSTKQATLKSHVGWKTKHFRGMTLEEIREKFIPIWKQFEDLVPMASKEEGERVKRKGLKLEQGSDKKIKTSEEVSEEDLKEMMQLVPMEEVYVEALQVKHPIIDWEIHSE